MNAEASVDSGGVDSGEEDEVQSTPSLTPVEKIKKKQKIQYVIFVEKVH
jgi:hypothetical protein